MPSPQSAAYRSNYGNIQKTTVVVFPSGIASTLVRNAAEATIRGGEWFRPAENLRFAVFAKNFLNKYCFVQDADIHSLGFDFVTPGQPRFIGVEVSKSFGGG